MEIIFKFKNFLFFFCSLLANSAFALEGEITTAPNVPPLIDRTLPETVVVKLEAREFLGPFAEGKQYKFWGYNGKVPGPMIRVRLGDTVELHLSNHADSKYPHNIDIHAVNGPGGGAAVNLVAPGEEKVFRFKALHPGLYVYHCASPVPSIPAHIANGMYGLFLVEPKHGLSRVDHEFYVMESEFYTTDPDNEVLPDLMSETSDDLSDNLKPNTESGLEPPLEKGMKEQSEFFTQDPKNEVLPDLMSETSDDLSDNLKPNTESVLELSLEKGMKEQPDYVFFNGRQGALLREKALRVKAGEKIRIFFGNIGPSGIASFHIIGEIFDQIYLEGAINGIVNRNVQTTLVPSGGATIVELTIDVPGDYLLVDHSIFRVEKGALGLISAEGDEDPRIFESIP